MGCQALKERKEVNEAIMRMLQGWDFPKERPEIPELDMEAEMTGPILWVALKNMVEYIHGVTNEYLDGGDQLIENCTCGKHQ